MSVHEFSDLIGLIWSSYCTYVDSTPAVQSLYGCMAN